MQHCPHSILTVRANVARKFCWNCTLTAPAAQKPHPSTPQKSVRIVTPAASSPEDTDSRSASTSYFPTDPSRPPHRYRSSPPPHNDDSSSSGREEDETSDPFNPDASASDEEPDSVAAIGEGASNIGSGGVDKNRTTTAPDHADSIPSKPDGRRPSAVLDVDAFTRLLLTGQAEQSEGASATVPSRKQASATVDVTPSTTSTSSGGDASVAAVSESAQKESSPERPRSSLDISISSPNETRPDVSQPKKPKPPPPRTRHGKPVQQAQEASLSSSSRPPPSPTSVKSPPGTPPAADSGPQRTPSQSKKPPAPPLTRRHSHMRASGGTKPSDQFQQQRRISLPPGGAIPASPGLTSPGTEGRPPPPPSRRRDKPPPPPSESLSASDSPSQKSSRQDIAAAADSEAPSLSTSSPPSRQTSVRHAPSGSTTSGSHAPPPPPPPRRNRESSKGSAGHVNLGHIAAPTGGGETSETLPVPQSSHADEILASLSQLQKEVDELRGQFQRRQSSH